MRRILLTGMSGTGKSTVIAELAKRGHQAVDLDTPAYSHLVPAAGDERTGIGGGMDWVWNLEAVGTLLDTVSGRPLFLSGCSPNQGQVYPRFDRMVLLTAPTETIVERLSTRTTNDFGKNPHELANTLAIIAEIEPLLRRSADLVIDTTAPLDEVVRQVLSAAGHPP
jgi:dephospho-CoA kinase